MPIISLNDEVIFQVSSTALIPTYWSGPAILQLVKEPKAVNIRFII